MKPKSKAEFDGILHDTLDDLMNEELFESLYWWANDGGKEFWDVMGNWQRYELDFIECLMAHTTENLFNEFGMTPEEYNALPEEVEEDE